MIPPILQSTTIDPEQIVAQTDSARATIEKFAENLAANPQGTLESLLQDAIHFGIKLLLAILIYIIGAWLIRKVRKVLVSMFTRRGSDKALCSFVTSLVSISLTILLIILVIGTLGINTTSLAALLAAGGMAIGMALSGTVQNFAGGIMILVFKPFKAGDFIEAQGYSGTVNIVTIVSTTLTTVDNKEIIIPNGALFNGNINNYSRNPLRRVDWEVNVEYGTDAAKCSEKLLELVRSDSRVLDASSAGAADPRVVLSRLDESSVVFSVRAWVKTENYWDVYFDFNNKVYSELPKSGIAFPFPQLDVNIKSGNTNTSAEA